MCKRKGAHSDAVLRSLAAFAASSGVLARRHLRTVSAHHAEGCALLSVDAKAIEEVFALVLVEIKVPHLLGSRVVARVALQGLSGRVPTPAPGTYDSGAGAASEHRAQRAKRRAEGLLRQHSGENF